jgi:hypothetical protein
MSRPRMSLEKAIAKFGTLAKYEQHLESMKLWHKDHAEEQKKYREINKEKSRERTKLWRKEHHTEFIASLHTRRKNSPERRIKNIIDVKSRKLADSLGIDRKNKQIHHFTNPVSIDNFVVLKTEDHRYLHNKFGKSNKHVDLDRVLSELDNLQDPIFVINGKVTRVEEV